VIPRHSAFYIATCLMWGALVPHLEAQTHDEKQLKSFYIVTHAFSDAAPFFYEYVLDVKSQGEDVLVRQIRLGPTSTGCPSGLTVKAADRLIKNETPKSFARHELCSLSAKQVASAIEHAHPPYAAGGFETASYSVVAMCGSQEKVFELPDPEAVNLKRLKRTNPQAASLWDMISDVYERSFGKDFSFHNTSDAQDAAFQALGAETAPAIKAGLYARGFENGSHLESLLDKYSGPVKETPPVYVEFAGSKPADLFQYQLPKYPPLARQTRIGGEVHLTLTLDTESGNVKDVRVDSGHPLLVDAAVAAVRDWHFQQGSPPEDSIEVALRFVPDCLPSKKF
jgi:TonB family protein